MEKCGLTNKYIIGLKNKLQKNLYWGYILIFCYEAYLSIAINT